MAEPSANKPPVDLAVPEKLETATFSMGCFWSPDALFGSVEGMVRTWVGYAGGTTPNPTYWSLADHIETVQLEYDSDKIAYQDLLHIFFSNHKPMREPWKRQYASAVFFHNQEQEKLAYEAKGRLEAQLGQKVYTELYPYAAFYLAEDRHQKYKLQRQLLLWEEFREIYPGMVELVRSTAAARVNAYLYGYGSREKLVDDIAGFGLSPAGQEVLFEKVRNPKEISCDR